MNSRLPSGETLCEWCGRELSVRGLALHKPRCPKRPLDQVIAGRGQRQRRAPNFNASESDQIDLQEDRLAFNQHYQRNQGEPSSEPLEVLNDYLGSDFVQDTEQSHSLNDIRIEYHPSTEQPPDTYSFDQYCSFPQEPAPPFVVDKTPWRPFRTKIDFEVAEIMLDGHLNRRQIARMIDLIQKIAANPESFTLENESEHEKIWKAARETKAKGFEKHDFSVEYKGNQLEYTVWLRPLWSWCQELLSDPRLIGEFHWSAEKLYKYNGTKFERIIDEPWTANAWWELQTSALPKGASPFCIILYADKTKLSSFGTEKGYPVLVRCANLPVSIRNGEGTGGGRLIGWLPIPEEDSQEASKKAFVNLKREIWHRAMQEIISSIEQYTILGTSMLCADQVERQIFPHILILSADFEEQSMMALTRGPTSSFPCPVCLVPKEEIPNLSRQFPLRTTENMERIWSESQDMNLTQREEYLQGVGLRDVKNVFWSLHSVDVYKALSWDRLHAYGGLFEDHLFEELRDILKELGRPAEAGVDMALQEMPRWSGLTHFRTLLTIGEISDGSKIEDLSKVIIYAALHILPAEISKRGFALLKLIQSFSELNMFSSLTVQTESTIATGRSELLRFEECLHAYEKLNGEKTWTFPKVHTHQHMFQDILDKGATRNFSTKPNEKANGPYKKYYQRHTNFKDVAGQVLRVSEMDLVSTMIRNEVTILEDFELQEEQNLDSELDSLVTSNSEESGSEIPRTAHGPICTSITFQELETSHLGDPAFQGFRIKLAGTMAHRLKLRRVNLRPSDEITPYLFVKVAFMSTVDWKINTNILRANPNFHNRPRYDYGIIQVLQDQHIFAQILYIFRFDYMGTVYNLALILPMDVPRTMQNRARDSTLRLTRVHARPRHSSVIIDTNSIIRGAFLVKDHASDMSEFHVVSSVDEDMFIRMQSINLMNHAPL
ncbi:hypothetical protein CVT26_005455 [Gymnopilus dilepis]|uniref:Uncharacterized protein n=1 Tax=Gymnopilus dilepis TaxID=231916 RepID=A0A409W8G0_9AGAR|nr:hypothetical protein CVT26_005455 [Gymnopilus dilepis]